MKLTRKEYAGPAEKKKDFWLGIGLFFGVNILLAVCSWVAFAALSSQNYAGADYSTIYVILYIVLSLLPWVVNIGLIIYFALTRSQIALGMVAGFGIGLLVTICVGVVFAVWCFGTLGAGGF